MIATKRVRRRDTEESTQQCTVKVYRTVNKSGLVLKDEEEQEVIGVHKFITDPAFVRVSAGVTKNMGNYESLRIDVAISVPCYREEVVLTTKVVSDMVSVRLEKEIDSYIQ